MDIYLTCDITTNQLYYFVPDATTQAEGEALGITNSTWIIGDLIAANAQLSTNQTTYLNSSMAAVHFSCLKSTSQDDQGQNIWVACDLSTEQPNTDVLYELFCDVIPGFQSATGLDQANAVFANEQQTLLGTVGLNQVTTLHQLPPKPTP
jgi:hypothetical protein